MYFMLFEQVAEMLRGLGFTSGGWTQVIWAAFFTVILL